MTDRVGQQFGNYRLIRLLGQGSFAEVYLGEHVSLKTQVAIKALQTRLTIDSQESFLAEARTISSLKHPNIVRILESGVEGNTPFLIMDYIPRGSLRQYYPAGTRLPRESVLSYVQQVAAALQYIHDQKLIHRDVKPENMLLGPDNKVLLSDFGIALISRSSRSQNLQEMAGTVAYMAPEQLKGKPCAASDQYALGIVTYEWLSGDYPFQGSFTEIASQHVLAPPPPLHKKVPEISPALAEVVQIALAKDPKWRFAHIQAFANALEQASKPDQPSLEARTFFVPNLSTLLDERGDQVTQPLPEDNATLSFSEEQRVPTPPADPPQPLPMPTGQRKPAHRHYPSVVRTVLLIALALFVATSSIGLISYYAAVLQPGQLKAQATRTARILLTAHAQATAQAHILATGVAQAYNKAEATAEALTKAEARVTATARQSLYVEATNGRPVIDDPLLSNNGNQWVEGTSSTGQSCAFTAGAYHATDPQLSSFYPCFANATTLSNFAFQVQMTILKGDSGGVVFRADHAHANYCLFGLVSDGTYQFYCYVDGSSTLYLSSGSRVGHPSPQPNLLTVIAQGSNIVLYVNKQYVGDMRESLLSSGEIGVFAQDNTQSTDVAFSQAQVWNW